MIRFAPKKVPHVRIEVLESYKANRDNGKDTGKVSIAELQFVTPEPSQQ